MIETYIPVDQETEEQKAQEDLDLVDASFVRDMIKSEGWKVIERQLLEKSEEYIKLLLLIPVVPENLNKISAVQAQVNGCQFVLNLVKDLASLRKEA